MAWYNPFSWGVNKPPATEKTAIADNQPSEGIITGWVSSVSGTAGNAVGTAVASAIKPIFVYLLIALAVAIAVYMVSRKTLVGV